MPPTLETSDNLSPKQKKRLIELIIEKFTESETFGWKKESKKASEKPTRGLKSEMPVVKNSVGNKEIITLKDFLENEIFPIIREKVTFDEVKGIIRGILAKIDNDIGFDSKIESVIKSIEKRKNEKMQKIFEDIFSILKDEVYNERMSELAGKLKGVTDIAKPENYAEVIPLFGPKGRKR